MKIVRTKNPDICYYLVPWFITDEKSAYEIGAELYQRMKQQPEDTYVQVGVEGQQIKSILIAYTMPNYVHIWQARKDKDMNRPRLAFHKLCRWAKRQGYDKLRLATPNKRVRRMYKKKYGFVPLGGMEMEKQI